MTQSRHSLGARAASGYFGSRDALDLQRIPSWLWPFGHAQDFQLKFSPARIARPAIAFLKFSQREECEVASYRQSGYAGRPGWCELQVLRHCRQDQEPKAPGLIAGVFILQTRDKQIATDRVAS